jgi:hypothetical protein
VVAAVPQLSAGDLPASWLHGCSAAGRQCVAPKIGLGGDIGIFSEEVFADRSDEDGRLFLLVGRKGSADEEERSMACSWWCFT